MAAIAKNLKERFDRDERMTCTISQKTAVFHQNLNPDFPRPLQ